MQLFRKYAAVDPVGVDNDTAAGGLAEDFGQPRDVEKAAVNKVVQYSPRTD